MRYQTPGHDFYTIFRDFAEQPHLLIAGSTGSGKSTIVNGIIHYLLQCGPWEKRFCCIDLKRIELDAWRGTPHCAAYADTASGAIDLLRTVCDTMDARFSEMRIRREKLYSGPDLYVIIDELADLMTTAKAAATPLIQRIGQLGRAAKIHLIVCTQCPLATIISTAIKCNLSARIGLHTVTAQDSRNILGVKGCESLPQVGHALYMTPRGIDRIRIPKYPEEEFDAISDYWTTTACIA